MNESGEQGSHTVPASFEHSHDSRRASSSSNANAKKSRPKVVNILKNSKTLVKKEETKEVKAYTIRRNLTYGA